MRKIIVLIGLLFILMSCQREKDVYNIMFFDAQGSIVDQLSHDDTSQLTLTDHDMTKEGYQFVGWKTEDGIKIDDDFVVTGDLKLYPIYQINRYQITFDTDGGSSVDDTTLAYNEYFDTIRYITEKEGYDFVGWYLDAERSIFAGNERMPANDVILYAKWKPMRHEVTFHYASGISETLIFLTYESYSPFEPFYTYYIFEGWYEEDATEPFDFSEMPNHDVVLYERRTEKVYEIEFVTGNGYTIPSVLWQPSGSDFDLHLGVIYEDAELMWWYYDSQYQEPFMGAIPANKSNLTLYALWSPKYLSMHQPASENVYHVRLRDLLYEGIIEIPETFRGLPVTVITDFRGGKMREVVIPKTVTNINAHAFMDTVNLRTVTFHNDSELKTIGAEAFMNSSIGATIYLPDGLTDIGMYAFRMCRSLLNIYVPSSIQTIEFGAFIQTDATIHIALYGPTTGFEDGWYNDFQTVVYLTD